MVIDAGEVKEFLVRTNDGFDMLSCKASGGSPQAPMGELPALPHTMGVGRYKTLVRQMNK